MKKYVRLPLYDARGMQLKQTLEIDAAALQKVAEISTAGSAQILGPEPTCIHGAPWPPPREDPCYHAWPSGVEVAGETREEWEAIRQNRRPGIPPTVNPPTPHTEGKQ